MKTLAFTVGCEAQMTAENAAFVYCANAFSLGVEAIGDPMGSNQRP